MLQYLGARDRSPVLPGFIRYYFPTPYPSVFSTIGFSWNTYQFYWKNWTSTQVGYSDAVSQLKGSTPLAIYTGVEAILYIRPILQIFDFLITFVLNLLNYPIELIITRELIPLATSIPVLVFFVHFMWFIHFYIYFFIFFYLLYYFFVYYYWKAGFKWFYEWMFEEITLINYNNRLFWHTLNHLWVNYKTPEQLVFLAIQTNLLMHYTFFNYVNFCSFQKSTLKPLIHTLVDLYPTDFKFKDLQLFGNSFDFSQVKSEFLPKTTPQFLFYSFFNIYIRETTALLFTGGSQCSPEHLIWGYLDYLNQVSHFLSWSLWKNYYLLDEKNELTTLMRHLTILFSSVSSEWQFLFVSQPILDSLLARKLMKNFYIKLRKTLFSKHRPNLTHYFYKLSTNENIFSYTIFLGAQWDFNLFNTISGLDIYELLSQTKSAFITKKNTTMFWNDKWFWLLAFFWSFRFVPKIWYPGVNLNLAYEDSWLHLSWVAYSNSWIGQSTYVWPFFNLVQHLWWTSKLYVRADSLLSSPFNLNAAGLNRIDGLWNFFEKRYSYPFWSKIETIFGFVRSLALPTPRNSIYYNEDDVQPSPTINFDLSFPPSLLDKWTTERFYFKTNPPLDIIELGLSPQDLFDFFQKLELPFEYAKLYLSFLTQLPNLLQKNKLIPWNIWKEFAKLTIFDGIWRSTNQQMYPTYEYYFKKFDFLLRTSSHYPLKNWIFSFDVSFFFSHFLSWDFFTDQYEQSTWKRLANFSPTNLFQQKELTQTFANLDMLAKLTTAESWFSKPFGVLDKFEVHTMKKYRNVKVLDNCSFSWTRDDPFVLLDWEHTVAKAGYAVYPQEDPKTLEDAYKEEYAGFWNGWFPYNPAVTKNAIQPLLIGWVGTINLLTNSSTNLLYSLLYASANITLSSGLQSWDLWIANLLLSGTKLELINFFGPTKFYQQLYVRAFTWVNIFLHPASFRYSFGPKISAWCDYWSWKCNITFDYKYGLYSYWPYMGFWHSFGMWMIPYDPLYGLYWSYWQSDDNPLIIDLSTEAVDHFYPIDDDTFWTWVNNPHLEETWRDWANFNSSFLRWVSLPYREVYYSFQHPYFIGYLIFWLVTTTASFFYLGLVNFSIWWFVIWDFLEWNTLVSLKKELVVGQRRAVENWYWKQMIWYRIYYTNPTKLMTMADCTISEELDQQLLEINTPMHWFYLLNCYLFRYFSQYLKLSTQALTFTLNFWYLFSAMAMINWYSLDMPFSLNPYLVVNNYGPRSNFNQLTTQVQLNTLVFSQPNTLREMINFNLFYDWSSGVFLDKLNLISYVSTFRGTVMLNDIFFDSPTFLAATFVRHQRDLSLSISRDLFSYPNFFVYHDLLISHDLCLHNAALVDFFSEAIDFFLYQESFFVNWLQIIQWFKFYFSGYYFQGYHASHDHQLFEIDSKIAKYVNSYSRFFKQLLFFSRFQASISYDIFLTWFLTGLVFPTWNSLVAFLKTLWFRLFTRYQLLDCFYRWIGFLLRKILFKK
jgi:hypothetical protein